MNAIFKQIQAGQSRGALWVIAVLLAFLAGMQFSRPTGGDLVPAAFGQAQAGAGARGIFAFTGQIDRATNGLFMLDVDTGTVWCYEIDTVDGVRKLRLIAARSWVYDRYLTNFNCSGHSPSEIRDLVAQQRDQRTQTTP